MAKPYDSASKFLVDEFPGDWLALAGLPVAGPVEVVDANLATITAEADKVIRVGGAAPWLAHIELQASRDPRLGSRLFRYNALLDDRHDLPTRSVAVLLRPEADAGELAGEHRRGIPGGPEHLVFRYDVLRVWQQPVATFLEGGLGTLSLAPVSDLGGVPVGEVIRAMGPRIDAAPPDLGGLLWSATSILMGLSYPAAIIQALLSGVRQMKESTMYQAILAEGKAEGMLHGELKADRRLLIRQGERRFGPASAVDRAIVEAIAAPGQLEDLCDLAITADVHSWADFWALARPSDRA